MTLLCVRVEDASSCVTVGKVSRPAKLVQLAR